MLKSLSFRDRCDIILEKRLSGIAGLRYAMIWEIPANLIRE
jgi:hypothetical protein